MKETSAIGKLATLSFMAVFTALAVVQVAVGAYLLAGLSATLVVANYFAYRSVCNNS